MSLRTRLLFALCCLLPPAAAGTVDEDLDAYLRIARVRVSSAPDALFPSPGPFHRRNTLAALEKLARRPRPIEPDELKLSIILISAKVPSDAGLRRAGEIFIAALDLDIATRRANHRAEREALFLKAGQACIHARSEGDLVVIKQQLAKLHQDDQARTDTWNMDTLAKGSTWRTLEYMSTWQDLLRYRALGETSNASAKLGSLLFTIDLTIIPRSRLLELRSEIEASHAGSLGATRRTAADPKPLLDRLERIKTLADLAALAPELEQMAKDSRDTDFIALTRFTRLLLGSANEPIKPRPNRAAFALEDGSGVGHPLARPNTHVGPRLRSVFDTLIQECRLAALQAAFPRADQPPRADESSEAYVLRVAQAAAARDDWAQARETLERYQTHVRRPAPAWIARELNACQHYTSARRFDEAGELPRAISSYQDALQIAGTLAPVSLITDRLAALRVSNPEAFDAASRLPNHAASGERTPFPPAALSPVLPPQNAERIR